MKKKKPNNAIKNPLENVDKLLWINITPYLKKNKRPFNLNYKNNNKNSNLPSLNKVKVPPWPGLLTIFPNILPLTQTLDSSGPASNLHWENATLLNICKMEKMVNGGTKMMVKVGNHKKLPLRKPHLKNSNST